MCKMPAAQSYSSLYFHHNMSSLRRLRSKISHDLRRFPVAVLFICGLVFLSPLALLTFSAKKLLDQTHLQDAPTDHNDTSGLRSLLDVAKPVFDLLPVLAAPNILEEGHLRQVACPIPSRNPRKPDYHTTNLTLSLTDLRSDGDAGVWDEHLQRRYEQLQLSLTLPQAGNMSGRKEEEMLVFIVPFSHADPGWLNTVEEYFLTSTKLTLDNMLHYLQEWPDMTFIWAETSYFKMWWETLSPTNKTQVKQLIHSGRLELVNGGYVMPDEANCHYYAILHQYIYGHQWLHDNVGTVPEHGFSIDPFGHSSSMPYLLKNVDLKTMFIQRIHYNLRHFLAHNQATEFMWDQVWDADEQASMFCHLAPHHLYTIRNICSLSPGTCYFFDFKDIMFKMEKDVLQQQAKLLLTELRKTASIYKHNVVLYILGDDFRWSEPGEWLNQYHNYKKLIQEIHNIPDGKARIMFGTLKDYYNAVFERTGLPEALLTTPHIQGDFFPYADKYEDYWTGYFTSRPFYKQMSRELERDLRTAEMLYIMARVEKPQDPQEYADDLIGLQRAAISLGLFQHHDAITGTSKKLVALDYGEKLQNGLMMAHAVILKNLFRIAQIASTVFPTGSNIILDSYRQNALGLPTKSVLRFTATDMERRVFVFNPLARSRQAAIHLRVDTPNLLIVDSDGKKLSYQISPVLLDFDASGQFADHLRATFFVQLDPLALKAITVKFLGPRSKKVKIQHRHSVSIHSTENNLVIPGFRVDKLDLTTSINITNPFFQALFSPETGDLEEIVIGLKVHRVALDLKRYETQASGAYLFRPNGIGDVNPYPRTVRIIRGHLFTELQMLSVRSYVHLTRVYHTRSDLGRSMELEITSELGGNSNSERVLRLISQTRSNKTFYTDSNGFQIIRRHVSHSLPWAANYYPATTFGFLQDNATRITMHLTQAHGVGSLKSGQLEVMLDRNLMQDDGRGVGEALQDLRPVRTLLSLQVENEGFCTDCPYNNPTDAATVVNMELNHPPYVTFEQAASNITAFNFKPMLRSLPCDVHLVMMKPVTYRTDDSRVGFLFHRLGMDCASNRTEDAVCDMSNVPVLLNDILAKANFKSYNETGFNFVTARKRFAAKRPVKLEPMTLAAITAFLPSAPLVKKPVPEPFL